jgi:hypothetical protein
LVLFPLPFVGCGFGNREANGHLLSYISDAPPAGGP